MKEKEMFDSFRFDELFFCESQHTKKEGFLFKGKVFCGKLKSTVGVKKKHFCLFFGGLNESRFMIFVILFFVTKKQFQIFCLSLKSSSEFLYYF